MAQFKVGQRVIRVVEAYLVPLTDPRADAFLESIKKIAREPNNIVAKEKA